MTSSLTTIQAAIDSKLDTEFAQPVYNTGIPNSQNLVLTNGILSPYLVRTFSDIGRGISQSFTGARGDDYVQPVNIMAVCPTDALANAMRIQIIDKMLGFSPTYAGELTKRPGGGTFTVQNIQGGVEAYVALVSFACTVQILDV